MHFIKKAVLLFIITATVIGGFLIAPTIKEIPVAIRNPITQISNNIKPCSTTIKYSLGSIDKRFNITEEQVKQATEEASTIWEKVIGYNIFDFEQNGFLIINLTYDHRQEATEKLKSLGYTLDKSESTLNKLKDNHEKTDRSYKASLEIYNLAIQKIEIKNNTLNEKIAIYNKNGGTEKYLSSIIAEKDILNKEITLLKKEESRLNTIAQNQNQLAYEINRLIKILNKDIDRYNSIGQSQNSETEEGIYEKNGFEEKITIYQYDDYASLVRILAHELGHALGMEHAPEKDSIMHEINASKNLVPTKHDIEEIQNICKK